MAESVGIVYGTALFELCCEQDCLESVYSELKQVRDVVLLAENAEFVKLMSSPLISGSEKADRIGDIFGGRLSTLTEDFLRLLAEKGRFGDIDEIYGVFSDMYNDKMNILEVTAITAEPLSERLRTKLIDKLCAVTGKKIAFTEKTDRSIIGGIVLRYANSEIDSSVKTRLDRLKAQIGGVIA
ncbi:MAG: ATP synthase F1 subunit delta [Ruminococcus sp.]|nr:ATP synthase F1 subunit delta [Ruminococcus sp.]